MQVIDGKKISSTVKERLKSQIEEIVSSGKRSPCLAVILCGDDPASKVYVGHKEKACKAVGIISKTYRLPATTQENEILGLIHQLNADADVDGILVQLPLPDHISKVRAIAAVDPQKDVDGLVMGNQGLLAWGLPGLRPCTPAGVMELLDSIGVDLSGKRAVVIGRSVLVGNPVAQMLMQKNATVTIVHSRTKDPMSICKEADVLVVAAGKMHLVNKDWVKQGAVVIDVGMHRKEDGKLTGDVDYESVKDVASALTPVPGGVGPMTIAMLLDNCVKAYLS